MLAAEDRHLVVRVSWVFGPDRPSFVDAMIKRAQQDEKIDAISDKFSTPTYTHDIAEMLARVLDDWSRRAAAPDGLGAGRFHASFCISQMPASARGRNTRNGRWIAAVMPVFL